MFTPLGPAPHSTVMAPAFTSSLTSFMHRSGALLAFLAMASYPGHAVSLSSA